MTVEGRVVADPELRFAPSGVAVGKFRVVSSSRKKNDQGEWVDDKTLWLQVTCFKQLAENVADSVTKGDLVVVVGRLQTDEWTTEGGDKRSQTVLMADNVGPSLMFRNIQHGGGSRVERSTTPSDDQWTQAPAAAADQPDDPPF